MGEGWVKGENTAIDNPTGPPNLQLYTDKLNFTIFIHFCLFLDDLECVPDGTILDHSFQPITVHSTFVLLWFFPIFLRKRSVCSFFFSAQLQWHCF